MTSITSSFSSTTRHIHRDHSTQSRPLSSITAIQSELARFNATSILLIVATLESILVMVLKAILLTQLDLSTQQIVFRLVFGIVFIQAFQLYYVIDTTRTSNMYQLVGLVALAMFDAATTIGELTRVLSHFPSQSEHVYAIGGSMFGIQAVCLLAFAVLAHRLYHHYEWKVYKRIGADVSVRKMYQWYQACVMMIKIFVYVLIPFIVDDILDDLEDHIDVDILVLHMIALFGVLVSAFLCLLAVRRESRIVNAFAISLLMGFLAYLGGMIYLATRFNNIDVDKVVQSSFGIALTIACILCIIKCQTQYDKGLLILHQQGLTKMNSVKQISRSALLDDDSIHVPKIQVDSVGLGGWKSALEHELDRV
jgi:hypothetical protein